MIKSSHTTFKTFFRVSLSHTSLRRIATPPQTAHCIIMSVTRSSSTFYAFGSTVCVHVNHVGFILGRECRTVNEVSLNTGVRIRWPRRDECKNGIVTFRLSGRSEKDVFGAYTELLRIASMADTKTPRAHQLGFRNVFKTMRVDGSEVRCVVPDGAIGMIIGSGGKTIDTISMNSNTWIKFYKSDTKSNGAPCFSVRGFYDEDVDRAVTKIKEIVSEVESRNDDIPIELKVSDVAVVKGTDVGVVEYNSPEYVPS